METEHKKSFPPPEWYDFKHGDKNSNYWNSIPEHTMVALIDYVELGRIPGDFLAGLICNDPIMDVLASADSDNRIALWIIKDFIYNIMPAKSWGSKESLYNWAAEGWLGR